MSGYKNYTDQDVINAAKTVKSMAGLLKMLGLKVAGGNYVNMHRTIQRLNIDCNHWTRQLWNKEIRQKDWSNYTKASSLKPHLIKERGHQCENCTETTWLDQPIPLEIEHVDGDRTNNELSNLKLLCCNCHALTPTWRRRKSGASGGT